jgi:glycosyltransferase involved in cell wall biosynthesis
MTASQIVVLWTYAAIIALWPIRLVVLMWILRRQEFLTRGSARYAQASPPLVSAILPAKDEEANLADCLRCVCGQDYPNLEILVIDDRSMDQTGSIARRFADNDSRVRVLTIDHLPAGWTGKTHALFRAAQVARGDWLWFLDADTRHAPEGLAVMMEFGHAHDAELVSLLPELRCESFWEHVAQPLGGIVLMQSFPLHLVHRLRSGPAFANGQYILVRRTTYDAAGGHEAVRDRFVEDIALARRVKDLGVPIRVGLVRDLVTCRMYASLGQLIRGWSRILYDALDRRADRLLVRLLDVLVFCQSGHLALVVGLIAVATTTYREFGLWLLGLSVIHHLWMYFVFRLIYNTSVPGSTYARWYPVGNVIMDVVLVRAIGMCLTGKVSWRGTDYGLATKRAEPMTDAPHHV